MQKQQNANVKTSYSLELWRIRFDNSNQTKAPSSLSVSYIQTALIRKSWNHV